MEPWHTVPDCVWFYRGCLVTTRMGCRVHRLLAATWQEVVVRPIPAWGIGSSTLPTHSQSRGPASGTGSQWWSWTLERGWGVGHGRATIWGQCWPIP